MAYELQRFKVATPGEIDELLDLALPIIKAQHDSQATFMPIFPQVPRALAHRTLTNLGVRLVGIRPSQQIVAHRDGKLPKSFERYHLPLQTNAGCWCFHDGDWQQLPVGSIFLMDLTKWHGAVNWGDTLRLHLMIDVLP